MSKVEGVGTDAPTTTNAAGGRQSASPYRADLTPPLAVLHVAKILKYGAEKYGPNNWHRIPVEDHLNHALVHLFAKLAGDDQDDHLGHAACRLMMALDRHLAAPTTPPEPRPPAECHAAPSQSIRRSGRPRVYIAGPISQGSLASNVNQATDAFHSLLKAGFAPLCPHWSCFAGGVRQGLAQPFAWAERLPRGTQHEDWLGVDLPWVQVADAILRLPGPSVGADREVAEAQAMGIPVFNSIDEVISHFAAHLSWASVAA